jgi:hypothetical protein
MGAETDHTQMTHSSDGASNGPASPARHEAARLVDASVSLRHEMHTILDSPKPGIGAMAGRCWLLPAPGGAIADYQLFRAIPTAAWRKPRLTRAAPMSD